ncbi:MAG: HlyD family efflux transporter periplasmic adaptor subunit [Alphaproteobacteria bacterium]|nr:HlyD family efflux transporter periplasmic adaptor subunit [Alphaproteobacteria bacterium]
MDLKGKVKIALGICFIGAMGVLAYEVFYWFTHVYESNARVQTDFTNISAQIDGKIEHIHVEEGGKVKAGQLLITLVHEDIKLNIDSLRTDLALEKAQRASLESEKIAFEAELRSKLETQREKIHSLSIENKSLQSRLTLAEKNLSRTRILFNKKLTPETKLTVEQDKVFVLQGQASLLRGKIAVAKKEFQQLVAEQKQIDVLTNKIAISDIKQNRIQDSIRKQKLVLGYRLITSPIDGVVGRIHKFKGEYVEDGIDILMLHDPNRYWIEAYVDESQIRHVRIDQDVLINFDAYPFEDYFGKVQQIGNITTAKMEGGGNLVESKRLGGSVERVPVRVMLDTPPPYLTPGMGADINVRIYEHIKLW